MEINIMYYLNTFKLHHRTTKIERIIARHSYDRDREMDIKLKEQHDMCFWCGCAIDMSGHLDHLISIYYGGTSTSINFVASCRDCNLTKGVDQIEILNPQTIAFYINIVNEFSKWVGKRRKDRHYQPNEYVKMYLEYNANLFTRVKYTPKMKDWSSVLPT